VSKIQEEIKDLVQSNIEEAVRYVYALSKGKSIHKEITKEKVQAMVEKVACILSKGTIKTHVKDVDSLKIDPLRNS
jgi:hypothetical protein